MTKKSLKDYIEHHIKHGSNITSGMNGIIDGLKITNPEIVTWTVEFINVYHDTFYTPVKDNLYMTMDERCITKSIQDV